MLQKPLNYTVFIVDDDAELCQSLQWLLEPLGIVTKRFNSSIDFLASFNPDKEEGCILLDIRMPDLSGLEVQSRLNLRRNKLPIIFMTGHGDIPLAVQTMKAGAFDFLTKPFNDQMLLEQIQKAMLHFQKSSSLHKQHSTLQERLYSLTPREDEVLKLVIEGKLNKEIAYTLNVSIKTIELHRSHIMRKMQASTTAELVKFYMLAR